jgi:hypothetical protein
MRWIWEVNMRWILAMKWHDHNDNNDHGMKMGWSSQNPIESDRDIWRNLRSSWVPSSKFGPQFTAQSGTCLSATLAVGDWPWMNSLGRRSSRTKRLKGPFVLTIRLRKYSPTVQKPHVSVLFDGIFLGGRVGFLYYYKVLYTVYYIPICQPFSKFLGLDIMAYWCCTMEQALDRLDVLRTPPSLEPHMPCVMQNSWVVGQ